MCLSEVSAVLNISESRRQSVLSVLTAERLRRRLPLKLWFAEEAEMEDWISMIQTGTRGQKSDPFLHFSDIRYHR